MQRSYSPPCRRNGTARRHGSSRSSSASGTLSWPNFRHSCAALGRGGSPSWLATVPPPDLPPRSWFKRLDPSDRGFVVADFERPSLIRQLGAEIWISLSGQGDAPDEKEGTRLTARLVANSQWSDSDGGQYQTGLDVELTGRWVLVNRVSYPVVAHGPSVLSLRVQVYVNRAK